MKKTNIEPIDTLTVGYFYPKPKEVKGFFPDLTLVLPQLGEVIKKVSKKLTWRLFPRFDVDVMVYFIFVQDENNWEEIRKRYIDEGSPTTPKIVIFVQRWNPQLEPYHFVKLWPDLGQIDTIRYANLAYQQTDFNPEDEYNKNGFWKIGQILEDWIKKKLIPLAPELKPKSKPKPIKPSKEEKGDDLVPPKQTKTMEEKIRAVVDLFLLESEEY